MKIKLFTVTSFVDKLDGILLYSYGNCILLQEEQRVIEAKIRMRQKEMQDDEEKMQKRLESCSSTTSAMTGEMEYGSASGRFICPAITCQKQMVSQRQF